MQAQCGQHIVANFKAKRHPHESWYVRGVDARLAAAAGVLANVGSSLNDPS
jgi:hypothetical protein